MKTWEDIEKHRDENGFIPEKIYTENAPDFRVCPERDPGVRDLETQAWAKYLSSTRKKDNSRNMYGEMYRYE